MRRCFIEAVLLGSVLLSGCALSLTDFREMSPDARADAVCREAAEILYQQNACESIQKVIKDAEKAVEKGYAVYNRCVAYEQPPEIKTVCRKTRYGDEWCKEEWVTDEKEVCGDITVQIDPDMEKIKLAGAKEALKECNAKTDDALKACRGRVKRLSPATAFNYYEKHSMP